VGDHTPGPWASDGGHSYDCIVAANGDHVVCMGHDHDEAGCMFNEADIPLIAAAPDLLSALKAAINTVECASIDLATGEELPWYRGAKAAIAKAEGR
jgi:hypothetical protein